MNVRRPLLFSAAAIAAMLALSAWAYGRLPDASVPVHWGVDGQPNGYAGKAKALLVLPGLAIGISLLMALMPQIMPRRGRLERSSLAYSVTWAGLLAVLLFAHAIIIAKAMGAGFDVAKPISFGIALLIVVLGNYMGKIRYNFVFGLRTPWTLADERVWDKTHRFTGWCMVACGLLLLAISIFSPTGEGGDSFLATAAAFCAMLPALAGVIFSILLSRRIERASPQS